jgi:hypothetical protein
MNREDTKVGAQLAIAGAVLLLLPSLWSLASAVWSAATTNEVLVISLGRTKTTRLFVPWQAGWARFVGPFLIVASVFVYFYKAFAIPQSARWWWSAALSAAGLSLLSFSWWFSSFHRAIGAGVLVAFICVALALGKRIGRTAAYLFIFASFCAFVWWRFSGGT